ncbi:unnamed protein product [Owenia fusiformis]|uniref:Uncharacterized protein n=1 Tax=Owenia fusiformis TaxID=6347 RepID=A0A8J1THC0_OWEFU|nr:unnamed protein product [Owenia fusiformis]
MLTGRRFKIKVMGAIIIISLVLFAFVSYTKNISGDVKKQPDLKLDKDNRCRQLCTGKYDTAKGYPSIANSGLYRDYLCPTMFRDMADYVYAWPYRHFDEIINTPNVRKVLDCLPPIPILYSKGDPKIVKSFIKQLGNHLKPGFILLTGQTDYESPGNNTRSLDNSMILRWYGSNPGITHQKFQPIPLGLNCYEHGKGMQHYYNKYGDNIIEKIQNNRKRMENGDIQKLAVINFGDTHPVRQTVKTQLCTKAARPYIECQNKLWANEIKGTEKLTLLYEYLSKYPFWVAPRGNGLDTHRIWEALYVGSIPIVQRSRLDPLFKDLPVLLIDNYGDLTEKLLKETLIKFSDMDIDTKTLHRNYWWNEIEKFRTEMLSKFNLVESYRSRCWATNW